MRMIIFLLLGVLILAPLSFASDPVAEYIFIETGLNMNSTADQTLTTHVPNGWIARRVTFFNCSTQPLLAIGGIYTGTGKSGTQLVLATQSYAFLSTSKKYLDVSLPSALADNVRTEGTIYFSLTTATGYAATCDMMIWGDAVTVN